MHIAPGKSQVIHKNYLMSRLRDDSRRSKAVLQHLQNENAYTMAALADTEELQETLYLEMRARIQEADQSVPVRQVSLCTREIL
jgi:oligopeptidase B